MSNIIYPKYKLPDNLQITSATASVGFSGSFVGDGSKLGNLPLADYVTKNEASGAFISSSQLNVVLSDYPTLQQVSGTFISGSELAGVLNNYTTHTQVSGTFVSGSELVTILNNYPTLQQVSGTFVSGSQIVNFITGVYSGGNLTGSGISGDPVVLKNEINVNAVTASYLLNGENNIASGLYSHAEGSETTASGDFSHSEGYKTKANEDFSHSEGNNTLATGFYSHAEGVDSAASGPNSHAEGNSTTASGLASHSEGYATKAIGDQSHAEGSDSEAIGQYSHAEGEGTIAEGRGSHSEGYYTEAKKGNSHAEGDSTKAEANSSHAEGRETITYGLASHAEGYKTIASASYQHVQGVWNQTSSTALHLIGNGDGESSRSNIFEVYKDKIVVSGSAEITDLLTSSLGISSSYFYGDGYNLTNISLSALPSLSSSYTLYVSADAVESGADGSFNRPFKTLQAAVDYASSSYSDFSKAVEIKVGAGVYNGVNVTRYNTYFVSQFDNHRQRGAWISGPTKIIVSGTQKYNEVCGFDGFLFNTGSGTEPLVHVQGTGSTGLYIQNCQFYSNTADSSCNLLKIDGVYDQEKVVLKDCAFMAGQTGADLVKITGGDVEFDSCRFIVSGSGASSAISASGDVAMIIDRALIENISSAPAIKFASARTFALSNASITKGGAGRAIESVAPTLLLNSYFGATGSVGNYSTNLNISGSGIYYAHLTSLIPTLKVTVTTGTPLDELHGNIYATNISASSLTGAINIPNVAYTNTQNIFSTNQTITGSLFLTNNVSASNITSSCVYTNYVDFNTSIYNNPPPPPAQLGRVFYNGSNGDISTYLDANGLILNNGQQLVQKCQNKTTNIITKGTVVHLSSSDGQYDIPRINTADWSNDNMSANTLGLTMQDIAVDGTGYVIVQGVLTGLSLSELPSTPANGQILYLSSSGLITNVKPTAPKHSVAIGQLIAKADTANNKFVYVSIQNGYELNELHDVSASNGKSTGDLLAWDNSNAVWKNTKELSGSYYITGSLTLGDVLKAPQKTKISSDPGELGQICWDDSNIYVYTLSGWKSSSLT